MNHFLKILFLLSFTFESTVTSLDSAEENSNLNYLYMDLYIGSSLKKQSFLLRFFHQRKQAQFRQYIIL